MFFIILNSDVVI